MLYGLESLTEHWYIFFLWRFLTFHQVLLYAGINFIQNHPLPGTRLEGSKNPPPGDNHSVQKPSPRDRTGSQKCHPQDMKSENFTNISVNSDTIWNEKLSGLNKKKVFQWGDWLLKYISFRGHQSQTTEGMNALHVKYKCMLIIFWEEGAWNFTKNISNFCRFLLSFL